MELNKGLGVQDESKGVSDKQLRPDFKITFGLVEAKVKIRKYVSFSCSGCLEFLNSEFFLVEEKLIRTGKVYFEFIPLPCDVITIQVMHFLETLNEDEKQDFIRGISRHAMDINPHPVGSALKAYAASQKISYHLSPALINKPPPGSVAEAAVQDFWSSGVYPDLYNYLVLYDGKEHRFDEEPVFARLNKFINDLGPDWG